MTFSRPCAPGGTGRAVRRSGILGFDPKSCSDDERPRALADAIARIDRRRSERRTLDGLPLWIADDQSGAVANKEPGCSEASELSRRDTTAIEKQRRGHLVL